METRRAIYEKDGKVFVMIPSPNTKRTFEEILAKSIPDGADFSVVQVDEIPSDRTFRDAWIKNIDKIQVDMPKARVIHMDRIRRVRDRELKETDVLVTREMEAGGVTAGLKAKRQELRNIPQTFNLDIHQTPESLKNAWPNGLPVE